MLNSLRIVILLAVTSVACDSFAQDLDDLFSESEKGTPCECHHHIFSLETPPDWMPKTVISTLRDATSPDATDWNGTLFFCPTTNAVIERYPLKRAYQFLVCPFDWQGFKPRRATEKTIAKNGIPLVKIRALLQSVAMGQLEVSVRARHSREMMGRAEVEKQQ